MISMAKNKATLMRLKEENYDWIREKAYKRNISQSKVVDTLVEKEKEQEHERRESNRND